MTDLGDYDASVRVHESIKRAVAKHVDDALPSRFVGWVLDSRFDADPNYGPLDVDNIGKPGSKVKVATVVNNVFDSDGNPVKAPDGRILYTPERSSGVIQAILPGGTAPLMDFTAVWIEGAPGNYRITDVIQSPYIDHDQNTHWQAIVKIRDALLTGRTGLLHTYDPAIDYPLGNDPTAIIPARTLQNLCTTPNFENGIGAWTATAGSSIAVSATHKTKGANGGGITFSVSDATARAYIPFVSEIGKVYTAVVKMWNSGNLATLGMGDGVSGAQVVKSRNSNDSAFHTYYVQYKAISVQSNLSIQVDALDASGTMHTWIDECCVTEGTSIVAPFDGSDAGASWTGATGLSTSVLPIAATQPIISTLGTSVKYGSPIYVPFYSAAISIGQTYYLGTWSSVQWDIPEAFINSYETPAGMVELTVKLFAGNDPAMAGSTSDAKFINLAVWVVKKYRFNVSPSPYGGLNDWSLIYANETTGPVNGVDFDMEVLTLDGHQFALRILYTRDDSPTRLPRFIGSISGWVDVENVSDTTEVDPNAVTDRGHRGTLEYQALHYTAKDVSNGYVEIAGNFDPSRLKGPLLPPAHHYSSLTQDLLSGGGNWTYASGCIKWSQLLVASSGARSSLQRNGYVTIAGASIGDVIPVYGQAGVTSVTATANGIPLIAGQTLYAELFLGGDSSNRDYRIVSMNDATAQFEIPSHWIMIAAFDTFGNNIKTGTGIQIPIVIAGPIWTALSLAANVVHYNNIAYPGTYDGGAWAKVNGIVYLRGLLATTAIIANDAALWTMPAGTRILGSGATPRVYFTASRGGGTAQDIRFYMDSAGVVRNGATLAGAATIPASENFSLGGLSYPADS